MVVYVKKVKSPGSGGFGGVLNTSGSSMIHHRMQNSCPFAEYELV
jgi:hypothetical protein